MRPGIELGVERVRAAAKRLSLHANAPMISVVGTNGKGSACRWMETLARIWGMRSGVFLSPWLDQPGEQIRLSCSPLSENDFQQACAALETQLADAEVTEFELHALVAMRQSISHGSDVYIFEAGMGGEGDAINAWDADAMVLTSIGLDHQDWLGNTREAIAIDKAGIARAGRPIWIAEGNPPEGLLHRLEEIGADVKRLGVDFGYAREASGLRLWSQGSGLGQTWLGLPYPGCDEAPCLAVLAASVAAFAHCFPALSFTDQDLVSVVESAPLAGRQERLHAQVPVLLDVAHNREAVDVLTGRVKTLTPPVRAVFAGLRDKPVSLMYAQMKPLVDHWYPAGVSIPRGLAAEDLAALLGLYVYEDVETALAAALADARGEGSVLVFGCFEAVRRARKRLLA